MVLRAFVRRVGPGVAALALAFTTTAAATPAARPVVPAGFTDRLVAAINRPVALAATPDGRLLVVDQVGIVHVIEGGEVVDPPALDISAKVCPSNERGMLGIAIDPKFASNGHVYLYYTFKKFPGCKERTADVPVNRVSRFTMVANTIKPSSEKVLIDNMISYNGNHNAGDLGFGKDGNLYASVGDGGCDYTMGTSGCGAANMIAQRGNTLQGKVLRIKAGGGIPGNNPFTGAGTASCRDGAIALDQTCQEIFMLGFRNPFRFAFDPNAAKTRIFVNDVGAVTWEEIDRGVKGKNYGWPTREGPCANGSTVDCGRPPTGFTNPISAYEHSTGCQVVTDGAFVPDGLWGAEYDSVYLYADYSCGRIFTLEQPGGTGNWTAAEFASGIGVGGPVSMLFATHGSTTGLYYTRYGNDGEVRVIEKTA